MKGNIKRSIGLVLTTIAFTLAGCAPKYEHTCEGTIRAGDTYTGLAARVSGQDGLGTARQVENTLAQRELRINGEPIHRVGGDILPILHEGQIYNYGTNGECGLGSYEVGSTR